MATSNKKTPESKVTDKPAKTSKASAPKQKVTAVAKPEVKAKQAVAPVKPEVKAKAKQPDKVAAKQPVSKGKPAPVQPPAPAAKGGKTGKAAKAAPVEVKPTAAKKNEKPLGKGKPAKAALVEVKPIVAHKDGKAHDKHKPAAKAATSKASASTSSAAAKKPVVAVFTMEDVFEVLKNRREEAREQAEKKEAAARKAATNIIVPETTQTRVLGAATLADILGFGISRQQEVKHEDAASKREIPEKYRKYYDMLIGLRDKIQGKVNQRGRVVKDTDADASLAVPAQTDDDDTFDHEFALSLVANEQDALMEIDAAMERIYEGSYGICEITGQAISAERLDAVPFARFSA